MGAPPASCLRLLGGLALGRDCGIGPGCEGLERCARGGGVLALAQDRAQPRDLAARCSQRHRILQLAGAALELQIEHFAVGLVDRLGKLCIGERARFIGERIGHR